MRIKKVKPLMLAFAVVGTAAAATITGSATNGKGSIVTSNASGFLTGNVASGQSVTLYLQDPANPANHTIVFDPQQTDAALLLTWNFPANSFAGLSDVQFSWTIQASDSMGTGVSWFDLGGIGTCSIDANEQDSFPCDVSGAPTSAFSYTIKFVQSTVPKAGELLNVTIGPSAPITFAAQGAVGVPSTPEPATFATVALVLGVLCVRKRHARRSRSAMSR